MEVSLLRMSENDLYEQGIFQVINITLEVQQNFRKQKAMGTYWMYNCLGNPVAASRNEYAAPQKCILEATIWLHVHNCPII